MRGPEQRRNGIGLEPAGDRAPPAADPGRCRRAWHSPGCRSCRADGGAGVGQDHAGPVAAAGCRLARWPAHRHARAAPARGAHGRPAHGATARRGGRRDRWLPGPLRAQGVVRHPDRGRDRRAAAAPAAGRPGTCAGSAWSYSTSFTSATCSVTCRWRCAWTLPTRCVDDLRLLVMSASLEVEPLVGCCRRHTDRGGRAGVPRRASSRRCAIADLRDPVDACRAPGLRALAACPATCWCFCPGGARSNRAVQRLRPTARAGRACRRCTATCRRRRRMP
jgi:hypothetical protein